MIELEDIRVRARRDLVIVTRDGVEDVFLWERSTRIARTATQIAQLPELIDRTPDPIVLEITGLYSDAGWISQLHDGEVTREQIGCKVTTPMQRELGAAMMEESLDGMVPGETIRLASTAIRSLNEHNLTIYESQLVAEAENLDAFGSLAIWHLARKHATDGRGLKAAIDTFQAQKQYGYWAARINDSLRFDGVKRLARDRLAVFDRMIQELTHHHDGDDIATASQATARRQ